MQMSYEKLVYQLTAPVQEITKDITIVDLDKHVHHFCD